MESEVNKRQKTQDSPENDTMNDDITTTNATASSSKSDKFGVVKFRANSDRIDLFYGDSGISLTSVEDLPVKENMNTVTLEDIISNMNLKEMLQINYMIDPEFLMSKLPFIKQKTIPTTIVHGHKDLIPKDFINEYKNVKIIDATTATQAHNYGVHHTKAMILFYNNDTMRLCIHTANLIPADWGHMTQAVYMTPILYKKSRHKEQDLNKYGHMRLRAILRDNVTLEPEFHEKSQVVCQTSSIGSFGVKCDWLKNELKESLSAAKNKLDCTDPEINLVFPTVENVRDSQYYIKQKDYMDPLLCKWKGMDSGRDRAMPHIKAHSKITHINIVVIFNPVYNSNTYTRMRIERPSFTGEASNANIAWFCLTSSNLSKAAWGVLQKEKTQLFISNYEMGVLIFPELFNTVDYDSVYFLNTTIHDLNPKLPLYINELVKKPFESLPSESSSSKKRKRLRAHIQTLIVPIRLPYDVPLTPYDFEKDQELKKLLQQYEDPNELINLRSLSMNNTLLHSIEGFPTLSKLRRLTMADNKIASGLIALSQAKLENLNHLDLSNNRINEYAELEPLKNLTNLKHLSLIDCPVTKRTNYRVKVFETVPQLYTLDAKTNDVDEEYEEDDVAQSNGHAEEGDDDEDELSELESSGSNVDDEGGSESEQDKNQGASDEEEPVNDNLNVESASKPKDKGKSVAFPEDLPTRRDTDEEDYQPDEEDEEDNSDDLSNCSDDLDPVDMPSTSAAAAALPSSKRKVRVEEKEEISTDNDGNNKGKSKNVKKRKI
ncbi:13651_t:CDS:10 [Entrophospora sp. SA101]|nr:13651_t:CDS:10 [Entrophospora sp. SA101]